MSPPRLEAAEVLRSCQDEYFESYSPSAEQRRVFRDVTACRTAALGGHLRQCGRCGHQEISYNSCGNRHCPKCQAGKQAEWLQARVADLLEASYFHLVFTLPRQLGPLALQNRRLLYGMLFSAASQTLLQAAGDEKHLGARIGFLAVLHTWGQTLLHHPHLHCVAPGGGLSGDGTRWIACRKGFFLPVRVLSRLFRGKFVHFLRTASASWSDLPRLESSTLQARIRVRPIAVPPVPITHHRPSLLHSPAPATIPDTLPTSFARPPRNRISLPAALQCP